MFRVLNRRLRRLCSRLRWHNLLRSSSDVQIKKLGKPNSKSGNESSVHPNNHQTEERIRPVKVATFNAALFSMAPAVGNSPNSNSTSIDLGFGRSKSSIDCVTRLESKSVKDFPIKSILKPSPSPSPLHPNSGDGVENRNQNQNRSMKQQKFVRSRLRVSINLPDNEISLRQQSFREGEGNCAAAGAAAAAKRFVFSEMGKRRTVLEVLRELDADILALQEVKAEEEKEMKPLSDLAAALGMHYVFAESWAPEYGNAILSKWPIMHWNVQKIFDDSDFRNVLKATINVPNIGEVNFHCTHLDHLDEKWRMKQVNAIIQSSEGPHLLAGGLNSLDETDYSEERWLDIVKYYEEMGKPTPKAEVMRFLKSSKNYIDAKDYAGECESVVMIAKGQNVQGTCKYGTRLDYIVSSPNSPYKFVPGSYSVVSSKGTSDHHIVKADIVRVECSSSSSRDEHSYSESAAKKRQHS
ncbi:hypothetical protein LINPERHAP2_LOCUS6825 [Linum perenne]